MPVRRLSGRYVGAGIDDDLPAPITDRAEHDAHDHESTAPLHVDILVHSPDDGRRTSTPDGQRSSEHRPQYEVAAAADDHVAVDRGHNDMVVDDLEDR